MSHCQTFHTRQKAEDQGSGSDCSPFCSIAFKLAMDVKNATLKVTSARKISVHSRGHMMEQQINEMVNKEEKR